MEIDVSDYTVCAADEMGKDGSTVKPVPPCASGEGFPYAPVDWPNPGDVWAWKVGNKISPSGHYMHRYVLVPKRLQKSPTRKEWLGSKLAITRYLQSEFPKADIEAFFATFTWKIPAEMSSAKKVKKRPSPSITPKKRLSSSITPKKRPSPSITPKKRPAPKAITMIEAEPGSQILRRTRNSTKKSTSLTAPDATTSADMHLSADHLTSVTAKEKDQTYDSHVANGINPVQNAADQSALDCLPRDSRSLADHLAQMTSEEFEIYLNSLDDTIFDSVSKSSNSVAPMLQMEDFTKAREELSSLLAIGLPSLIASNKLLEVKNLSYKLMSDPHLSREEHSMLNLVQEIPLASNGFLETNHATAEASKSSVELEALKSQYNVCKEKIALLQAEDASASLSIQEIDQEVAKLQSRRAKLAKVVKRNQKKMADLVSTQNRVFDSLMANSGRPQWELTQNGATNQEAEILAKFAPLEGFSFVH